MAEKLLKLILVREQGVDSGVMEDQNWKMKHMDFQNNPIHIYIHLQGLFVNKKSVQKWKLNNSSRFYCFSLFTSLLIDCLWVLNCYSDGAYLFFVYFSRCHWQRWRKSSTAFHKNQTLPHDKFLFLPHDWVVRSLFILISSFIAFQPSCLNLFCIFMMHKIAQHRPLKTTQMWVQLVLLPTLKVATEWSPTVKQ